MFTERIIAQTIALLRIQVRMGVREPAVGVQLALDTSVEGEAWRKWALDYLTAKVRRVKYVDQDEAKVADFYGELAGKRGENDPRSTH